MDNMIEILVRIVRPTTEVVTTESGEENESARLKHMNPGLPLIA